MRNRGADVFNAYTQNSWYEDAFIGELYPVWRNTPFGNIEGGELRQMCYQRSLVNMLRNNENSDYARRRMLYYYILPYFDVEDVDKEIDKRYKALSTDNTYLYRAMNNICVLYNQATTRVIDEGKNADKIMDILNESKWQTFMKQFYLLLKFTNILCYRPVINTVNGKKVVKHKIITRDRYCVLSDNYGNMEKIFIPRTEYHKDKLVTVFYVWEKGSIKKYDTDLKPIPMDILENELNFIPYLEVKLDDIEDEFGEIVGGAYFELLKAQLDCCALELNANENIFYTSFPIRILYNLADENSKKDIKLAPSRVFVVNQDVEGADAPEIRETGGADNYISLNELKINRIKQVLKNHGLPVSVIEDNVTLPESGVAIKEMSKELMQIREEDLIGMKEIEKQMICLLIDVLNNDKASPLYKALDPSDKYVINIDYGEIDAAKPFVEVVADNNVLLGKGYINPLQDYIDLTGDIEVEDETQLVKKITENVEFIKRIKELNNETSGTNDGSGLSPDAETAGDSVQKTAGNDEVVEGDANTNPEQQSGNTKTEKPIIKKEGATK